MSNTFSVLTRDSLILTRGGWENLRPLCDPIRSRVRMTQEESSVAFIIFFLVKTVFTVTVDMLVLSLAFFIVSMRRDMHIDL